MKAITLWQPWATLIAIGAKRIETRSWDAKYTGPLAIHAAQRPVRFNEVTLPMSKALSAAGVVTLKSLPLGCVVATCQLASCHAIGIMPREVLIDFGYGTTFIPPEYPERAFGDYTQYRWAWMLTNIVQLESPIPFRGKQGWFNVPDYLLQQQIPAEAEAPANPKGVSR